MIHTEMQVSETSEGFQVVLTITNGSEATWTSGAAKLNAGTWSEAVREAAGQATKLRKALGLDQPKPNEHPVSAGGGPDCCCEWCLSHYPRRRGI